jgi:hypothetical protein
MRKSYSRFFASIKRKAEDGYEQQFFQHIYSDILYGCANSVSDTFCVTMLKWF